MIGISAAILAALALAAPAKKQDPDEGEAWSVTDVRKTQNAFAQCVVRRRSADAHRYVLGEEQDGKRKSKLLSRLADPECLIRNIDIPAGSALMRFPGDTMRYAIADALIRKQLKTHTLTDLDKVAPLPAEAVVDLSTIPLTGPDGKAIDPADLERMRLDAIARPLLAQFGECVVRLAPGLSHDLIMTTPVTDAETMAFGSIKPFLGHCIDAGRSLQLNKITVRGAVALAYYRLSNAPRLPQLHAAPLAGTQQ